MFQSVWSRKGFLRTRWSIQGTVVDLINIHLFHDASNFVAMESYPSVYSQNRRRALDYTLNKFHNDSYGKAPYFLFGDFNFRTDTEGVVNVYVFVNFKFRLIILGVPETYGGSQ